MKKLIALLALAPIAAPAAKLCQIQTAATYSYNKANMTWAIGTGCSGETTGNVTTACSKVFASGVAYCATDIGTSGAEGTDDFGNTGGMCICRTTSPFVGIAVVRYVAPDNSICMNQLGGIGCAGLCGNMVTTGRGGGFVGVPYNS